MRFLSFDCESHLIKSGCNMPRLVCISAATDAGDVILLDHNDGLRFMWQQLEDPGVVLVGHNIFYDLGVLCAEDCSTFVPLVFKALRNFRIRDTIVRQQLIDIAAGDLKYRWDEQAEEYVKTGYHLADLCLRLLGRVLPKEDTWRLKYALLDGVPIRDWPEEARKYACDDATTPRDVFWAQAKLCDEGHDVGGIIPTEERAVREAWALHLMGAWGIRTDGVAVAKLREELEAEQKIAQEKLLPTGILVRKKDGSISKKMTEIYSRVEKGFLAQGKNVPYTGTGKPSTDHEALVESGDLDLAILAEAAGGAKLLNTYVPMLQHGTKHPINARFNVLVETNRTSCQHPNLQNPSRKGGVRDCFVPRKGCVYVSVDYDTIELRALAQSCLDLLGHSAMAVALREGEDLHVSLAAELLGLSYAEAAPRHVAGDEEIGEMRQFAKCVAGDTLVHTTQGFRPIRDLVEHRSSGFADLSEPLGIVSRQGVECATQGYYGGVQEVYELTTQFGLSIRATADHKFMSFIDGAFVWKRLSDLREGDPLFFKLGAEVHGNSVEIPALVNTGRTSFKGIPMFPRKLTPALARVLGFLVSEGGCGKSGTGWTVSATQGTYQNAEVITTLGVSMKEVFGDRCSEKIFRTGQEEIKTWRIHSLALAHWLQAVGFGTASGDQQIPTIIAAAPRKLKIEFLRALFEGDGSASSMGSGRGKQKVVRYCSKSRVLIQQLQLELLNLGIPSRIHPEKRKLPSRKGRLEERARYSIYWNLNISGQRHLRRFRDEIGFMSSRKNKVLESACEDRVKDQPVLFLPGDKKAWSKVRDRAVGGELREALTRPLGRGGDVSELLVEQVADLLEGDLETCLVNGLWMCEVKSIETVGQEEVFDLYEPKHEIAVFNGMLALDCANFGYPGGLGSDTFVSYAKAMAGITITSERSKEVRDAWFRRWPEMKQYFEHVSSMTGPAGEGVVVSPRSGFVRGGLSFTKLANHYFQSLTATGAKDALFHVTEECYNVSTSALYGCRPVIFMHDEILLEAPEERSHEAAERLAELMIERMKVWIPDVPVKASPAMFRRWYKGAKPVRVNGRLVPSKPVKDGKKTVWVADLLPSGRDDEAWRAEDNDGGSGPDVLTV